MSRASLVAMVAGALALAACAEPARQPDFVVHGAGVVISTDVAFAARPDLPGRVESTLQAALDYWGGGWGDLEGRTITLDGADHVVCQGVASAIGCFDGDIRISTSDMGEAFACVEQTALVHEVGHAVIGDAVHDDPRWMDFAPLAQRLEHRTGYRADAEVDCPIAVSVWRHPPRR